MIEAILQQPWLLWSIGLMVGFPLAMVGLNEGILKLQRQRKALANTLKIIRNWVMPTLVLFLFVTQVMGLDPDLTPIRLVQTLLLLATMNMGLSFVNIMLFVEAGSNTWQAQVPKLLRDLVRFFLILMGTALVLSLVWKTDLGGLITALGVSSIVIGLALQDTLGNLFSGIALLFGRPFKVGDWLQLGETVGKVNEVNWRAVHLMTREQEMLIIPNSVLAKEIFKNYNQPIKMHVEPVDVGFSYNDPPNKVKRVMLEVALATKGVLEKPPPVIQTINYNDSSIDYRVRLFLADYSKVPQIRDEFMTRVWYAANRYGLNIPFPIRTVFHQQMEPANLETERTRMLEELRSLPSFAIVESDTLTDLLPDLEVKSFGQGETIIRQGDTGVKLHLILKGQVKVSVNNRGLETEIDRFARGEFFGTLTLLSNEPTPNTVIALDDLEVVVFETEALHIMLARTPRLAQEMGAVIEARRSAIELVRQPSSRVG
ncbi:mechanosensitive ion channel family protein [Acaryochloris thomasi]|nr:mechanosensitive ion channel family protein [Acaryochloris thomasi]